METITVVSKLLYHKGVDLLSTQNHVLVDRDYVTHELMGIPYWEDPGTLENPNPNNAEYKEGDLVQLNGKIYKCLVPFSYERPDRSEEWACTKLKTRNTGVIDLMENSSFTREVQIQHNLNSRNLIVRVYEVDGENMNTMIEGDDYEVQYGDANGDNPLNVIRLVFDTNVRTTRKVLITSLD